MKKYFDKIFDKPIHTEYRVILYSSCLAFSVNLLTNMSSDYTVYISCILSIIAAVSLSQYAVKYQRTLSYIAKSDQEEERKYDKGEISIDALNKAKLNHIIDERNNARGYLVKCLLITIISLFFALVLFGVTLFDKVNQDKKVAADFIKQQQQAEEERRTYIGQQKSVESKLESLLKKVEGLEKEPKAKTGKK